MPLTKHCSSKQNMATAGKKITCKAAVLWEFKKPMTIETIEVEPPGDEEVRVKMVAVGLCHSDYHAQEGYFTFQTLPCILGHEGAGIVESVGKGVTHVKPGDKILTSCMPQCRQCPVCKDERSNACMDSGRKEKRAFSFMRAQGYDGTPRFFLNGKPIYIFVGCSAFSEYTVIPANSCVKIDSKAPLEKACLCACGIPTGYGAATKAIKIRRGDSVAIWGVGGVGLASVLGAKHMGAGKIIGIATSTNKESIARKMGCTDFIASKSLSKPITEVLMEKTECGLDFAIVCVGDIKAMEDAVLSTKPGGTMVIVGATDAESFVKVSPGFMLMGRKIIGTALGDYKPLDEFPDLVTGYLKGKLPLDEFVTNTFKLDDINDAFAFLGKGQGLRSVILM